MFIRDTKDIFKRNQIELLEMNTIMSEINNNTLGDINSRLDVVEEKISELEDVLIEAT